MKVTLVLAVLFSAVAAFGDPAPTEFDMTDAASNNGPTLEVKETGTRKQADATWQKGYGSADKSFMQRKKISVVVSNLGDNPAKMEVDVLWMAARLPDGGPIVIERQTFPVEIAGDAARAISTESPEINLAWLHRVAIHEDWVSGSKMAGWVVIVRRGNVVMRYKASSPTGEAAMRDSELLSKLLITAAEK